MVISSAGCGSKAPPEANAALDAALSALAKGDAAKFMAAVVPEQREKVAALPQWGFFQATKSHKIDNEFDLQVTENSAMILTTLYFDAEQKAHNSVYFVMKKADGKWLIDLDDTIKKQIERDGADAFQAWEIKIREK
jgi:hypothetical protein